MEVIQIAAIGIIGAILAVTLQQQKKEMALVLTVAVGTLMLLQCAGALSKVWEGIRTIAEEAGLSGSSLKLLLKLLAASYVVEFGSEICKDAGQQSLAAKVQLAGKLVMAGMAVPVFSSLLQLILELMP